MGRKETPVTILRGELRCFACSRFLGEFESHPEQHGRADVHLIEPKVGTLPQHPVRTPDGLRCSHCGGRAVADYVEKIAA